MIKIILLIIISICVTVVYDARQIAEKYFSKGQTNKQVKMLKIIAFIIAIICGLIIIFLFRR